MQPNPTVQFLLHKLNIPPQPALFPPIRAAELLSRGFMMVSTTPFEWMVIDKPAGR
jgi:hypothetical protein